MAGQEITQWLERWRSGDAGALERLLPLVYDELRRVARRQLLRESPGHTLSSTALVHEVYLRLAQQRQVAAEDRAHFFAIAGRTMRRILVDHARARASRGRDRRTTEPKDADAGPPTDLEELLALDDALQRLGKESELAVRVVECRVFAGMTLAETARMLGMSSKSVQRIWSGAAAFLRKHMRSRSRG
ncbi:MAG TPA: ECF-type sigma factor [Myxococcaceae bacterium]|nr:ECF-type sigma factor [Myxococcaceae bacterium]